MSFSIQTNVNSLVAQENLRVNGNFQSMTITRLTSGYRINSSGDDAAGLAIANKFRSDTAELSQGVRNANDGISTLQIIDGGMNNVSKMLDRLRTLSTQSASDTFTGDRTVLNSEFQSLMTEIDRQAQSIGLSQGGQFAKSLEVFIGGGKSNSGDLSTSNGVVGLDLRASTVDTKSLGLKGFQVIAGSADIGGGSVSTSVAKIIAQTANGTSGIASFSFAGPGFSDGSKVKVDVNLSGVTDINTLVTNINTAIQNAGNGTTQAATAFKSAGLVATVNSTSSGKQIAFTSSTTAFQVEAGNRMANALMGSFSDASTATGNAVTRTLTGGALAAAGNAFVPAPVTVRITGAGLAAAKDITLTQTTVGTAVSELATKINSDADLMAAGITVDGSGANLVFTSARGESFNVLATGDAEGALGLGSFVQGNVGNAADYTSIVGAAYDRTASAVYGNAKLEFSLDGEASVTTTTIDLAAGDADVATAVATGAKVDGFAISAANDTLNISLNGAAPTVVTLAHTPAKSAAVITGSLKTADTPTITGGSNDGFSWSLTDAAGVTTTASFTLTAGATTGANILTDLNSAGKLQGTGITASFDATSGNLKFTTTDTGGNVSLTLTGNSLVTLGILTGTSAQGGAGATMASVASQIQTQLGGSGVVSVTAPGGILTISTVAKGSNQSINIEAGNANGTLNLIADPAIVRGRNRTLGDIVNALNQDFSSNLTLQKAGLKASPTGASSDLLTFTSNNSTYFRVGTAGSAATANVGFGVTTAASFAATLTGTASSTQTVLDAGGTSFIKDTPSTNGLSFADLRYGSDDQSVTIAATDAAGVIQSLTVTLQNDGTSRAGRSIDESVALINQKLQQSNIGTLQKIVAVKDNSSGTEKINFLSSLSSFTISTGSSTNALGLASGAANSFVSQVNGTGGTVSIDTKEGAKQAVVAVAAAVTKLGTAQAAIGKGQNQLNYAVTLAQSQISSFSAAESRIRDADVAAEAANMTKAQVLQQASIAAMAQANSAPQAVLSLLRG